MADTLNEIPSSDVEMPSLTDWANEPTLADLTGDFDDAKPDHDSQVTQIGTWLDNLHVRGAALPDGCLEGHSRIQPKLIRKQAEWRYASLTDPFLSTENVFNIDPVTAEDVEAAYQNGLVLNMQFNTQLQKVAFFDDYAHAAVDEGTVFVRVGWDFEETEEEVEVPVFDYVVNPQTTQQHAQLHQLMEQNAEEYTKNVPPQIQEAHRLTMETGQPFEPQQVGTKMEMVTQVTKNQPILEVCDYRNLTIDPSCQGDLSAARFIIYSFETSLSELEKSGKYKNLDQITVSTDSVLDSPDHATDDLTGFNFQDKPRTRFVAYEYWGYWDIHDTGETIPIVATYANGTMIRMEENPFPDQKLPFVSAQYLPIRRSVYGEPDGALLEDNQKIVGAVTRGMIDIMGRSANGQQGSRKDALDLTNKRKFDRGQDYEYNATVDPRLAFHMHTYPEIPGSAEYMLGLQNAEAESLSGIKAFSSGITGNALGDMLDIRTLVPMYSGSFKELGDVRDGDEIIASNGGKTTVTVAHTIKYPKRAYDLTFSSGAVIKAGGEHRWTVKMSGSTRIKREWHTVDTDTLYGYMAECADNKGKNVYVPRVHRPRTTKLHTPLDPYCLGAWLGDGNSHGARITSMDTEIVTKFTSAGFIPKIGVSQNSGKATNYDVFGDNERDSTTGQYCTTESLHSKLRALHLLKRYGGEKHIPQVYFEADYYVKLELLRGLMDTDGYAHTGAFNVFCQTEGRLKDDFIKLIYSMGGIPRISKCISAVEQNRRKASYSNKGLDICAKNTLYEIGFTLPDNPFSIARKAEKYKPPKNNGSFRLVDIQETDCVLMRCLTVDSADRLYAVGKEYTLTHNTATGVRSALDATAKRELAILRRLAEGIKQIGRKVMSMNKVFLSEEEVVRVTNDVFVPIRRDALNGNVDISLSISTAEVDDQKAQELAFMLQTMGNSMPPEMSQMVLGNIADLRNMPRLAKQIKEYKPEPDPLAEQMKQLQVQLLQAQVENEIAHGRERLASADLDEAKADTEIVKQGQGSTGIDQANLDRIEQESGITQQRELDKYGEQAKSNARLKAFEHMLNEQSKKTDPKKTA